MPEALEGPLNELDSPKRRSTHDTESTPADGDPAAPEDASDNRLEQEDDEQGEHPRVSLVGRLGSAPRFRTTQQDLLIGRFPLAVHHDDASTTWHPIVVFGERAAALQGDELTKGELVNVVGYEHERTWTDKKGDEKTELQIYAAVIART